MKILKTMNFNDWYFDCFCTLLGCRTILKSINIATKVSFTSVNIMLGFGDIIVVIKTFNQQSKSLHPERHWSQSVAEGMYELSRAQSHYDFVLAFLWQLSRHFSSCILKDGALKVQQHQCLCMTTALCQILPCNITKPAKADLAASFALCFCAQARVHK